MAVTVASSSVALTSGTGAITLNWPAHQAGDIGVISQYMACSTAAAWADPPAGWEIVPDAFTSPSLAVRTRLLWKRAASGAEASVSVPTGTNVSLHAGRMTVLRGCVAEGTPFEIGNHSYGQGIAVGSAVGGSASYQDGALAIMFAGQSNDSTAGIFSNWRIPNVTPPDMTELFDSGTTTGSGACLGLATRALTADEAVGCMRVDSSMGAAYTYDVGAVAVPGTPNGMRAIKVDSDSGTTTTRSVTVPAGAAKPGDLIIVVANLVATASRTISFTGATAVGSTQSYPSITNTNYNRIGWAIATGEAQTITVTSSGAVTRFFADALVVSNLADVAGVIDGGSTNGTGTANVVLPDSPSCMYAFHYLAAGTTNSGTPVSAFDPPAGFCSDNVAKGNSYSSYYCCFDSGGLTKSVKGASFAVANDTKWVVHSIFANGTPVGGGGGSGPAMFWSNNF
jgi:hypothetical protein